MDDPKTAPWPQTRHFWFDGTAYRGRSDYLDLQVVRDHIGLCQQAGLQPREILDRLEAEFTDWLAVEAEVAAAIQG